MDGILFDQVPVKTQKLDIFLEEKNCYFLAAIYAQNWTYILLLRGSVAEWSARWTRNPAGPFSSPALVLGRPEIKSLAMLVNSQLVVSWELGFLILLCFI